MIITCLIAFISERIELLHRRIQQSRRTAEDQRLLAQMNAHQLRDIGLD